MKMRSSVIWIKVVALISVLLMNTQRADMTLDEVEATLQFEIATDTTPVKINPEGPLNFLRGYIYQKMDCMYNKRFFSPQIKTDYLLKKECIGEFYEFYTYNRDRQMDKAYRDLSKNKMDEYNEQYHSHLIDLFPSPTGDITIETRGNQSFVQFLRADKTKKHALQILALLLLFSEGVNIHIDVSNTVLKVYETNKKDKIYFEVSMAIPWKNDKTGKEETFQQKKVNQMIKFFKKNATKREVLSIMEDRCSYDEVATGKFLDSPKFLIQSYIFGFIESAENAIEFIQTVHTMAERYAPKTEAPSKDDSVYDRLFKPASTATDTDCMALMKKTQEIMNGNRDFSFTGSMKLPRYTSVPMRDPITKVLSAKLGEYSNCVECMILSLFCCLAYDPSDSTYKTDHMGNVSESLKEFFAPENQPFDTTKNEFQIKWCNVVACLDEPSITYCKGRNELDCGIINMLMVIAEIVNAPEDEKKKILGFSQSLKKEIILNNELSNDIQQYTKELLKHLSKTKNIEIEFFCLTRDECTNGRYDVYGEITILFEQGNFENKIVIKISQAHSSIKIEPIVVDSDNYRVWKLNGIAQICKNGIEFIGNLFSIYVDYEARNLDTPEKNKEFIKAQVRKTIENNFADINRLLLIEKMNDLEYKKKLVACSIAYTLDKKLLPMDPIIRFISNIIGSTELDNSEIQLFVLSPIMCAGLLNKNSQSLSYPNIEMTESQYENVMGCAMWYDFVEYVLDCDISIFIVWIKYCIDNFSLYNSEGECELLNFHVAEPVFKYIFKDNNMEYANAVDEVIAQDYPKEKDVIMSYLHYTWFMYLILQETPNIELVKANFDAIQNPNYIPENFRYHNKQIFVQALTELKNQLCTSEDSIAKFDELMRQYKPNPTTS
ncbi:hypothetical protein NERG_00505 [Nematocida ausubeli]|uniref:Uncharacterized protein n=1 Tax=Nematocida ausubeli (strain ATCC PRA-371 / ERTm2) TaxID=1913371 RepID=H8ZA84_NEMA1|nr:hypothetical protein NERG_00505 [Nematocida ausubeli]